ncbi:3'-5' exonuclease, partial [Pseudomonas aeruginosa]|uniref:3'-5' exonuclease n=1 Tax=Pseudomonas aeruginosa TaxID=287 RepID=UPI003967E05A
GADQGRLRFSNPFPACLPEPIAVLRSMVMDIDYENWLRQNASSDKVAEFRMSNVWFLIEALKNTLERDEEGDMTIEQAIAKLVLRDMLERQQEEEEGAEGVQMMTLHASKGLEFPYVFIMGMEEEILPHRSSIEADTVEEERRLAYVGITRARQNLAMTFAAKRKQYGEIIDCSPSRFLDELPPEDLEWEGMEDAPQEVKAAKGNAALADIRAMLKR